MCYFRNVNQISNMNEIQTLITRIISRQTKPFNYESIVRIIKQELRELNVPFFMINSFRVNNMIIDTLDLMVSMGNLYSFNNIYVPQKTAKTRKTQYAFA